MENEMKNDDPILARAEDFLDTWVPSETYAAAFAELRSLLADAQIAALKRYCGDAYDDEADEIRARFGIEATEQPGEAKP